MAPLSKGSSLGKAGVEQKIRMKRKRKMPARNFKEGFRIEVEIEPVELSAGRNPLIWMLKANAKSPILT